MLQTAGDFQIETKTVINPTTTITVAAMPTMTTIKIMITEMINGNVLL